MRTYFKALILGSSLLVGAGTTSVLYAQDSAVSPGTPVPPQAQGNLPCQGNMQGQMMGQGGMPCQGNMPGQGRMMGPGGMHGQGNMMGQMMGRGGMHGQGGMMQMMGQMSKMMETHHNMMQALLKAHGIEQPEKAQ